MDIKEYNEKRQKSINDNVVNLLQNLELKMEHYTNILALVIEWADGNVSDLVSQKENYNSLLRTLKENLENTRNDIQTIIN